MLPEQLHPEADDARLPALGIEAPVDEARQPDEEPRPVAGPRRAAGPFERRTRRSPGGSMTKRWAVGLSIGSIVAALLLPPEQADGHGGRLQCELVLAGPYVVSVWTAPDPARAGALDISASILRSDTRRPVDDAGMRLTVVASRASAFVEGVGSRSAGGFFDLLVPRLYHARVEIPAPGAGTSRYRSRDRLVAATSISTWTSHRPSTSPGP